MTHNFCGQFFHRIEGVWDEFLCDGVEKVGKSVLKIGMETSPVLWLFQKGHGG